MKRSVFSGVILMALALAAAWPAAQRQTAPAQPAQQGRGARGGGGAAATATPFKHAQGTLTLAETDVRAMLPHLRGR